VTRRPYALGALAALAAAGVAEAAFRYLEPTLPTHRLWYDTLPAIRVQQMRELRRADVVFCGHSMVHCGIEPGVVLQAAHRPDLVGYNAGLHRGFYGVVGPFLVDTVIPMLRPSLVVLGASVFDLNDNSELLHDTTAKYEQALLGRPDAVGRAARVAAHHSAVFRNKGSVRRPKRVVRALQARVRRTEVVDEDVRDSRNNVGPGGEWLGYAHRGFHTTENMRNHLIGGGLGDFHAGGREIEHMKEWIRRIQALGPEVALCVMRPSDQFWNEVPEGVPARDETVAMIRALGAEAGVAVLEPVADLVDEEHYADIAHLNREGMRRFSTAVGAVLGEAARTGAVTLPSGRRRRGP
jgi:hypothetical protein